MLYGGRLSKISTMCKFLKIGKIMVASRLIPLSAPLLLHEVPNPPFSLSEERLFLAQLREINQWEQFRKWPPHLLWSPWPMLLIDLQQLIVWKTRPKRCQRPSETSSQSSKLRYFETTTYPPTDSRTGVKCRATSVAKKG